MKKYFIFGLFLIVYLFSTPLVYAHEKLSDGWHVLVSKTEYDSTKEWVDQVKDWAYYENGVELKRFSYLVCVHRGWGEAPENSLASFNMIKNTGYSAFETDVRFTKDNVPVLIHDASINGVAKNNDGSLSDIAETTYVKDLTFDELYNNYIFNIERGNRDNPEALSGYDNNRITKFVDMLDFVKANKFLVQIELKSGTTDEQIQLLVSLVKNKNMSDYVLWSSISSNLLEKMKNIAPEQNLFQIFHTPTTEGECADHNKYCDVEEYDYYFNKLKTDSNLVWLKGNKYNLPNAPAFNMPAKLDLYPASDYIRETIQQGTVTVSDNNLPLKSKETKKISYRYNGDGTVKCESSNASLVTCSVDKTNKTVTINTLGDRKEDVYVNVYSTQGVNYSASDDARIIVKKHVSIIETIVDIPNTGAFIPIIYNLIGLLIIGIGVVIINRNLKKTKENNMQ